MKKILLFIVVAILFSCKNVNNNIEQKHLMDSLDMVKAEKDSVRVSDSIRVRADSILQTWHYSCDTDKMTLNISYFSVINSIDKIDPDTYLAKLTIRKEEKETEILFTINNEIFNFQSGEIYIKIKFDQDQPIEIHGGTSSSGDYNVMFLDDWAGTEEDLPGGKELIKQKAIDYLLSKFKKAKKTLIKVEVYDKGFETIEFNTANLKWNH